MTGKPNALPKTGKREIAIGLLFVWMAITIKYFMYTTEALVIALAPGYSVLTTGAIGFMLACLGLKTSENYLGKSFEHNEDYDNDYIGDEDDEHYS